tara:strand:+ start:185 stop:529 length:345 start_codon:yes stop_codon:yes gene_type:complete
MKKTKREKQFIQIHVTFPSKDIAMSLARSLVKEGLVACAQISEGITSIYKWDQRIEEETEVLLALKTAKVNYKLIEEKIISCHPYDTPEVISFKLGDGSQRYYDWLENQLRVEV